jgi:hypothetical protein
LQDFVSEWLSVFIDTIFSQTKQDKNMVCLIRLET